MGSIDRRRLEVLESQIGMALPAAFVQTLTERDPIREGRVALVARDRVWDVRTTFAMDTGDKREQLDRVYQLVGDVLPPGALPFAEDWAGNFYCLMLSGQRAGQVAYWDHERDDGDHRVEPIADSVSAFYASLVPDPREQEG